MGKPKIEIADETHGRLSAATSGRPVNRAVAKSMALYLMNAKGLAVLRACVLELPPGSISFVVSARDGAVQNDYYEDIFGICGDHQIPFFYRKDAPACDIGLAIGWRWLIRTCDRLVVCHDSLLPRYRGFAPLPTALIAGEQMVGVTALYASDGYDSGDIIAQRSVSLTYPVKIQTVIERVSGLYADLVIEIARKCIHGEPLPATPQDESKATYSLWRDEEDYRIDWNRDASAIARFIDAVGYPYRGAAALLNGQMVRILDAVPERDVRIELRQLGKVIFVRSGEPVVVCGFGLLRLKDVRDAQGQSLLPLAKFRSRFA